MSFRPEAWQAQPGGDAVAAAKNGCGPGLRLVFPGD